MSTDPDTDGNADFDTYTHGHVRPAYVHTHRIAYSEYHPITHTFAHADPDTPAIWRRLHRTGGSGPADERSRLDTSPQRG